MVPFNSENWGGVIKFRRLRGKQFDTEWPRKAQWHSEWDEKISSWHNVHCNVQWTHAVRETYLVVNLTDGWMCANVNFFVLSLRWPTAPISHFAAASPLLLLPLSCSLVGYTSTSTEYILFFLITMLLSCCSFNRFEKKSRKGMLLIVDTWVLSQESFVLFRKSFGRCRYGHRLGILWDRLPYSSSTCAPHTWNSSDFTIWGHWLHYQFSKKFLSDLVQWTCRHPPAFSMGA